MNVLVTGASGQLGREWVDFLGDHNIPFEGFSFAELDITNREEVEERIGKTQPDIILNCAAYTDVDGAESESEKAFLVNKTGVRILTKVCEKKNIKFVHFSTDYVFPGSKKDQNRYPEGYPEDAETSPINVYGKSKEAGEKILLKADCEWLLIRVSWLCGQYGSNFVKAMLRLGSERDELSIVDDQIGCPSFTYDVVEKTWHLLQQNCDGIFHVSCKGGISWADFAEEIFKSTDKNVTVKRISSDEYPFIAKRPLFSLLSNRKAMNQDLSILPFKKGLTNLLEQIQENLS